MPDNTLGNLGNGFMAPYQRNLPYAGQSTIRNTPANYATQLSPLDEMAFRQWIARNGVPFDPRPTSDYDMRGFYQAIQQGDPRARTEVNPNDQRLHFTDAFKTPYHESFSGGSQYAGAVAPQWNPEDQLISPGGRILFDEKQR